MGNVLPLPVTMPTTFPASTATLCVLPLRTNGQSRFTITPGPMPTQLTTRLAEAEFHGIVSSINTALQPLSGFGMLSLLLPFVIVDALTLALLSAMDPWLLISPWDYPLADLVLPVAFEFLVIFCSFPLMAHTLNKRMAEVQRRVRALLDDSSRRFGARGISFQLKQGVLNNGAATNLWVEVQVVPLIHVQSPVPVPVPTICPIIIPSEARHNAAVSHPEGEGSAKGASSGTTPAAEPSPASAASHSTSGSSLSAQQVEYLRVLQENQLLRQYLTQCQTLVQTLAQQLQQQQQPQPQQQQAANAGGAEATAAAAAATSAVAAACGSTPGSA
jgi:hypothetical protein